MLKLRVTSVAVSGRRGDGAPPPGPPKGHKTFIICTAPHQVGLPTSTSLSALVAHLNTKLSTHLEVTWPGRFVPTDATDAEAVTLFTGIYSDGLGALDKALG